MSFAGRCAQTGQAAEEPPASAAAGRPTPTALRPKERRWSGCVSASIGRLAAEHAQSPAQKTPLLVHQVHWHRFAFPRRSTAYFSQSKVLKWFRVLGAILVTNDPLQTHKFHHNYASAVSLGFTRRVRTARAGAAKPAAGRGGAGFARQHAQHRGAVAAGGGAAWRLPTAVALSGDCPAAAQRCGWLGQRRRAACHQRPDRLDGRPALCLAGQVRHVPPGGHAAQGGGTVPVYCRAAA